MWWQYHWEVGHTHVLCSWEEGKHRHRANAVLDAQDVDYGEPANDERDDDSSSRAGKGIGQEEGCVERIPQFERSLVSIGFDSKNFVVPASCFTCGKKIRLNHNVFLNLVVVGE